MHLTTTGNLVYFFRTRSKSRRRYEQWQRRTPSAYR